jgi:hypothetical protein
VHGLGHFRQVGAFFQTGLGIRQYYQQSPGQIANI